MTTDGTVEFRSMTTNDNIRYGLVYIEDIYHYLERLENFSFEECCKCRRACCLSLPAETKGWKDEFVSRCYCEEIELECEISNAESKGALDKGKLKGELDKGKLFDIFARCFRHAHNKSHTIPLLFANAMKENENVVD